MKEMHVDEPRYVLGIDVGGTFTKVMAFTMQGEHVGSHAFESPRVFDEHAHPVLVERMMPLIEQAKLDVNKVLAIGLALPGAVGAKSSLDFCPNLDLDMASYQAFLQTYFPQACVVTLNDADAAVLGDSWHGSSSDPKSKNVVLLTLGTGVGAGIMVDGKLHCGAHGAAGEVGHLRVNPTESRRCNCGNAGCLEQYASATALVRMAREELVDQAHVEQVYPDARAVLGAAERGDHTAQAALDHFSDALGFGLAQIACFFDPDIMVLGGGLSESAHVFLESARARYRAHAISVCREIPLVASTLGNKCGTYGAAYYALDALEKSRGYRSSSAL